MSQGGLSQHGLPSWRRVLSGVTWWSLLLISLVTSGCGGSTAKVSGTVTLDGAPVEGSPDLYGTVSFFREGGGGAPAVGIIGSGGRYDLSTGTREGLEPGKYMVGISV